MLQISKDLFKELMCFLEMSASLHTRLATEMLLAEGEFLQVTNNTEDVPKVMRKKSHTSNIRDDQHFKPE
jgi:hypothetical protein